MDSATLKDEAPVLTRDEWKDAARLIDAAVPPPLCEWQEGGATEPCGLTATWLCTMACGHSFYYCDEHKVECEAYVHQPGANYCRGNLDRGKPHRGAALADPVRFERIER